MDRETRPITRREFVSSTGAIVGGVAFSGAVSGLASAAGGEDAPAGTAKPMPRGVLGRTGVEVSRLGIGCAPFGHREVGVEDVDRVLSRALELGVDYIDAAPNYGDEETGFSEVKMGPVVRRIRDRIFLVTKTEEPTYEGTWRLLRQSMKRLQTDRLDLVHLHNFGHEPRFSDLELVLGAKGALGALREARKQGVIRFIGASGHLHPSRFHAALDTGEIDVLMNAVNLVVRHTYDFEHKVWSRARRDKLGLVAMKVLGGRAAEGFRLPEELYGHAIRYALSVPGISAAVVGVKSVAELEQAAAAVSAFEPLGPKESLDLARRGLELAATDEWREAYGTPLT